MYSSKSRRLIVLVLLVLNVTVVAVIGFVAVFIATTTLQEEESVAPTDSGAFLEDSNVVNPPDEDGNREPASNVNYEVSFQFIDENENAYQQRCIVNDNGLLTQDCAELSAAIPLTFPSSYGQVLDVADYEFINSDGSKYIRQTLLFTGNNFIYRDCLTADTENNYGYGGSCDEWKGAGDDANGDPIPLKLDYNAMSGQNLSEDQVPDAISIGQYTYLGDDNNLYGAFSVVFGDTPGSQALYYKQCAVGENAVLTDPGTQIPCGSAGGWIEIPMFQDTTTNVLDVNDFTTGTPGTTPITVDKIVTYGAFVKLNPANENVLTQSLVVAEPSGELAGLFRNCAISSSGGYPTVSLDADTAGQDCDDDAWYGPVRYENEFPGNSLLGFSAATLEYDEREKNSYIDRTTVSTPIEDCDSSGYTGSNCVIPNNSPVEPLRDEEYYTQNQCFNGQTTYIEDGGMRLYAFHEEKDSDTVNACITITNPIDDGVAKRVDGIPVRHCFRRDDISEANSCHLPCPDGSAPNTFDNQPGGDGRYPGDYGTEFDDKENEVVTNNKPDFTYEDSGELEIEDGAAHTFCYERPANRACGRVQWDPFGPDFTALDTKTGRNFIGFMYSFGSDTCEPREPQTTNTPTTDTPQTTDTPTSTPIGTQPPTTQAPRVTGGKLPDTFLSSDSTFVVGLSLVTIPPILGILYARKVNKNL